MVLLKVAAMVAVHLKILYCLNLGHYSGLDLMGIVSIAIGAIITMVLEARLFMGTNFISLGSLVSKQN